MHTDSPGQSALEPQPERPHHPPSTPSTQSRSGSQSATSPHDAPTPQSPGTHTFLFSLPPPLLRQKKSKLASCWQNACSSGEPAASTSSSSQLRKHIVIPVDSNGEHTCARSVMHSPSTAQQSASSSHS